MSRNLASFFVFIFILLSKSEEQKKKKIQDKPHYYLLLFDVKDKVALQHFRHLITLIRLNFKYEKRKCKCKYSTQ